MYYTGSPLLHYIYIGGNKGIGKEIARRIATEPNYTVIIACRNLDLGREAIQDLRNSNNNEEDDENECDAILLPIPFDLTNKTSIENAARWIANEYNGTLDILINNAAICYNSPTLYYLIYLVPKFHSRILSQNLVHLKGVGVLLNEYCFNHVTLSIKVILTIASVRNLNLQ